ncbi:MAG: translation initiation factor IF-3 [Oscillospiraceae bacterium]|nr:translation initiation factor IF-3 [Oscillospiraceae bacterium]
MINDEIDFAPNKIVRVVGENSEQIGLLSLNAALNNAYDKGLDLVLIAPQAEPPVCRMMDYGKFRFERDKKDREARKKQQVIEIKEIQITCLIDTNDLNTKINHARRFLTDGDKVKVVVKFKGRQMNHLEMGYELLARFESACADLGNMEKKPVMEGRSMIIFIAPIKQQNAAQQSAVKQ